MQRKSKGQDRAIASPPASLSVRPGVGGSPLTPPPRGIRGKEQPLEKSDRILPLIKLMQALSPEVRERTAAIGEFVNNLTHVSYGSSFTFVPILRKRQRIKWLPKESGGGMDCRSFDGKMGTKYGACAECTFSRWENEAADPKHRPPACTEFWAFPIILVTARGYDLALLSLGKTQLAAGRSLANLIDYHPCDAFGAQYTISSYEETSKRGEVYHNVDIQGAGFLEGTDPLFLEAERWWGILHQQELTVDPDPAL